MKRIGKKCDAPLCPSSPPPPPQKKIDQRESEIKQTSPRNKRSRTIKDTKEKKRIKR